MDMSDKNNIDKNIGKLKSLKRVGFIKLNIFLTWNRDTIYSQAFLLFC